MRWLAILLLPSLAGAAEVQEGDATARFEAPTTRYGHDVLGGLPEWGRLCLSDSASSACVTLPETSVFEDIAPRLADMDGDGRLDAVVVESSFTGGASLVIYRKDGTRLTRHAIPPIGRRNRWLAPIGIADFDGDGRMDVAYIETPHLGKRLRIWTWANDDLVELARATGLTNHRIGEDFITSAVHDCAGTPTIALADANWSRVITVHFADGEWISRDVAPFSRATIKDRAAICSET